MKNALMALTEVRYDNVPMEGITVRVREGSSAEFSEYGKIGNDEKDDKDVVIRKGDKQAANAYLLSVCVVDEAGQPILSEEESKKLALSARVALPLIAKIMTLSNVKEDPEKHPDAG